MAALEALASVVLVSLVSLVGALSLLLPALRKHMILIGLVAFAAGALLGDAFFHLIGEAIELNDAAGGYTTNLALIVLAGFLAFFLIETGLRWHHRHLEDEHPHPETLPRPDDRISPFAWTNLIGDAIHNFIDGALIGATWIVSPALGVTTTIAVAAHEIPQELGDFAVLLKAGLKPRRALAYNLASALVAVLGTLVVLFLPIDHDLIELYGLPLIAGGFLYIAAADLIPELHHHVQARYIPVTLAGLLVGLGTMFALLKLE